MQLEIRRTHFFYASINVYNVDGVGYKFERRNLMSTVLLVAIMITFVATLAATFIGLLSISTGESVDRANSNLLMRARVILQAATIGLLSLTAMEVA
jgi:hypothetical protein